MGLALVVLLIIILIGLGGFAVKVLWWVALGLLVLWIIGWLFGAAEASGSRRWYGR